MKAENNIASIQIPVNFCNYMAGKIFITSALKRIWDIEGYPNYFFAADNQLYHFDSRGRVHRNKRTVIGYTTGYVLKSKFFSLAKLRPMLRRHAPHQ